MLHHHQHPRFASLKRSNNQIHPSTYSNLNTGLDQHPRTSSSPAHPLSKNSAAHGGEEIPIVQIQPPSGSNHDLDPMMTLVALGSLQQVSYYIDFLPSDHLALVSLALASSTSKNRPKLCCPRTTRCSEMVASTSTAIVFPLGRNAVGIDTAVPLGMRRRVRVQLRPGSNWLLCRLC